MHRALAIQEVVEMILIHVDSEQTLASFSRTCRSFFLSGVSCLWETMDASKFMHLWHIVLSWDSESTEMCIGDRWARFQIYASLVRKFAIDLIEFNVDQTYGSNFHDYLHELVPLNRTLYLLPRLRSLDLIAGEPMDLRDAVFLLSPLLDDVFISCAVQTIPPQELDHDWVVAGASFLDVLPDRAPNIRALSLMLEGIFCATHSKIVVNLITRLQHLKSFRNSIQVWEPPMIAALASLHALQEVDICFKDDDLSLDVSHLDARSFPSLRELRIRAHVKVATALLEVISDLEELSFEGDTPHHHNEADILRLTSVIGARGTGLKHLRFTLSEHGEKRNSAVRWDTFAPLCECVSVKHFFFTFYSKTLLDLRDRDVKMLATSMPLLKRVVFHWTDKTLLGHSGLQDEHGLTLGALGALAQCPDLRIVLFTTLSARVIPPPPFVTKFKEEIRLLVRRAPIIDYDLVAGYLSTFWPKMRITIASPLDGMDPDMTAHWWKVGNALRTLRTANFMEECKGLSPGSFRDRFTAEHRRSIHSDGVDPWPPLQ